jgi:hypothetical protein
MGYPLIEEVPRETARIYVEKQQQIGGGLLDNLTHEERKQLKEIIDEALDAQKAQENVQAVGHACS